MIHNSPRIMRNMSDFRSSIFYNKLNLECTSFCTKKKKKSLQVFNLFSIMSITQIDTIVLIFSSNLFVITHLIVTFES